MAKRIYVGSLPYSTNDQELNEVFSAYGVVTDAKVITDRGDGRSKGFGFVEMANDEEAEAAITALNGSPLGNRTLTVNEARPMEPRKPFAGNRGGDRY